MSHARSRSLVAGVDEVGRGPLAGPVVAAAVVLDGAAAIDGLADSKQLSPARREALARDIEHGALGWSIGRAEVEEIDRLNILHATLLAMRRAVLGLAFLPRVALIDGNRTSVLPCPAKAVVRGDASVAAISAASIIAKVARDREMVSLDAEFPHYGFARHKGYATAEHLERLRCLGPCPVHRRSFRPVRDLMQGDFIDGPDPKSEDPSMARNG